jgi:long-chain acyl-CoA synthetase
MDLTTKLRELYAPGVAYNIAIPDRPIPDMVLEVASRYPRRAAIDFFARQLTYEELAQEIRQAAGALYQAGVRPGDRVALVMPNCPQHAVAVLGTMLLGAVVVEHNPLAPAGELEGEYERHGARVTIAWSKSLEKLTFLGRGHTTFCMDLTTALPAASRMALKLPVKAAREKREQLSSPRPSWARSWTRAMRTATPWRGECPSAMEDVALLIHTGGTTGVPKAAALTHANLMANVEESIAWVPVLHEGAEVFYCILPLFHAFGFTIGFLAGLRLGATIAMFPKFDTALVLAAQRRLPCTFFLGVPPMYERLLAAAEGTNADLSSIHFSLSGAMPLSAPLAEQWEQATGGLMIEGYGMTEASPILLGSPLASSRARGALGIPFPSTQVRIVDPENPSREVADGEVGELIARGPQVFSGYWNQDEETAEVFTEDGWLRTGDLVQVRNGFIYMADRRKEMINSSGFNVYPSQVEEAVRSMPGILDVAAIGVPAGESGEDVVAAVVLEAGASVTLGDLRKWAEKSLAHYALPRQIVVMTELPRSQLGKVMRKKVREQILGAQAAATDAVAGARDAVAGAREAMSEKVAEARGAASEAVAGARGAMSEAMAEARETMSERVAEARETASEAMAGARDSVAEAVAGARESVSEAVAGVRGMSAGAQGSTPTTGDDAPTADHQETTES